MYTIVITIRFTFKAPWLQIELHLIR